MREKPTCRAQVVSDTCKIWQKPVRDYEIVRVLEEQELEEQEAGPGAALHLQNGLGNTTYAPGKLTARGRPGV